MVCEIVWAFTVLPSQVRTFEAAYGPEGPWARLFGHVPDFRGTRLLNDLDQPGRYLSVDVWSSLAAYKAFQDDHMDAFNALDTACSPLFTNEHYVGAFEPRA